jgi:hypothetical protein
MFGWFKRSKKRRQRRGRGHRAERTSLFDFFHGMVLGHALAPDEPESPGHHHHDAPPPPHDQSPSVPDPGPSFDPGDADTSGVFDGGSSGGGGGAEW